MVAFLAALSAFFSVRFSMFDWAFSSALAAAFVPGTPAEAAVAGVVAAWGCAKAGERASDRAARAMACYM